MAVVRWVDVYFAFQEVQRTLTTLQGIKEKEQACYDPKTQTFSALAWTQWSPPSTDDLVQGLDATVNRVYALYDYFQLNYTGLRGWTQYKLAEERGTLHEKAGLCLKLGFKHLKQTYQANDQRIQMQFDRLKRILKEADKPAPAKEPCIDDLAEFIQDLKANTQKLDPRCNDLLREEAKKWIEKVGLFAKTIEVAHPNYLKLFLDFFLEGRLQEFESYIDRLCVLNRSGAQEGRKELTIEIAAILSDISKAETLYHDLLDAEKLQEFTTCRLIGKVAQTMTESRISHKVACEIAEQSDEILKGLLGAEVCRIPQTDDENNVLEWQLGVVIPEKLVASCIADRIRKPHLSFEGVVTAYNHWELFARKVEDFFWGSHSFVSTGEIKEGEVRCPARSNNQSGLYHFWARENFSTSSNPVNLVEFTDLFRFLRAQKGESQVEPLIMQFDHTWQERTHVDQVRILFNEAQEEKIPHFIIPLVPSQRLDRSRELNIKSLALLLRRVLPLLKTEDFENADSLERATGSLEKEIQVESKTAKETNVRIEPALLSILNGYKRQVPPPPDTPKHQMAHVCFLAIKALYAENSNPLLQTELLLLTGISLGGPMHAMDANGLDRSGIGRALWEALWQMTTVKKCTPLEIYEVIQFLSTDNGAADLRRYYLDAAIHYETKNQKKPLQTLEQDYDNTPPAGGVPFSHCLREQILAKNPDDSHLIERAIAYCSFYTASLIKTGGIIQFLGTGVVGAKYNHDSESLTNTLGMAYTNPWAEKRLLPFVETEKGNLIQLFNPTRGTYTPAGMDIIHRLSQRREKDFINPAHHTLSGDF